MIERFIHTRRARFILAASAMLLGAVVFYYYLGTQGPSYKEVIVACGGLIVAVIIFGRELGVRYGFVLWVLTLMLGYRTVAITREFAIHPSEILLWLLLICILAQRNLVAGAKLRFPIWLWLFIPFWVLAWWPTITGGLPWDRMLNEFRNFLLIIPLMIVTPVVLKRDRYWRYLMLAFFVTGAIIALMGNLEYWLPAVTKRFPAFMTNAAPTITEEGFERAQFSFWGGPPATFICLLSLPAAIALMQWWPRRIHRTLIGLGAALQILGIYIGGYRSIWLILLLQLLTACVLRLRKQGAILAVLCLVIAIGGWELIPRTTERAISGISALQGTPTDSSATGRKRRAIGAVEITLDSPLGNGWSSAGWTHSDFLQVAVNLGVFGGLIFFLGCLYTLLRLGRHFLPDLRRRLGSDLGLSLFLSFMGVFALLLMEGVTVLPQMALPVWFVWALAEVWLRQTAEATQLNQEFVPIHSYPLVPVQVASGIETDV